MFDISFGEIMIVAVVALIVIGPEKMPKVARTLGLLAGRMQRYVATVKGDIERELKADELRRIHGDVTHQVGAIESEIGSEIRQAESVTSSTLSDIGSPAAGDGKSGA